MVGATVIFQEDEFFAKHYFHTSYDEVNSKELDNRYAAMDMALHKMKRGGDMTSQQIDIINVMCVEYIVPVVSLALPFVLKVQNGWLARRLKLSKRREWSSLYIPR